MLEQTRANWHIFTVQNLDTLHPKTSIAMAKSRWSLIIPLKVTVPSDYLTVRRSLLVRLHVRIPTGHRASGLGLIPIPDELKRRILEKHQDWLQACTTGDAAIVDPLENELAELEAQAKAINQEGFTVWKFQEGGYGTDPACPAEERQ